MRPMRQFCIPHLLIAALFALLSLTAYADQNSYVAREYRRGAEEIWNQQQVQLSSEERALKSNIDLWQSKLSALLENNKDIKNVGKFGDGEVLSREPLLPSMLASDREADLTSAVKTKSEQLERIRADRQRNPDAVDLYGDEVRAVVAVNSLNGMLRNAKLNVKMYEQIETYLVIRIAIASAISRSTYSDELVKAKSTLADLYRTERTDKSRSIDMMRFFLRY